MPKRPQKARLNLKIDPGLKEWAKEYAKLRGSDITKLICEYLIALRQHEERQDVEVEQI